MKRRADMTIQYAFLIFLATITVFVVIGIIAKNSLSAQKFICRLTGECGSEQPVGDIQKINVTCSEFLSEIVKHARLCNENGKQGRLQQGNEPICYIITADCSSVRKEQISDSLTKAGMTNFQITFDSSNKAIISYDYQKKLVRIE
ncbi:MAG: hypothetical protein QXW00_00370 [Candidatus Woesearchaeota archaeon]